VTISASTPNAASVGASVSFTASASGGGTYEYQFYLFDGSTYTMVQAYSTVAAWTWETAGYAPGTYNVVAYARSVGSPASSEAGTSIPYGLNPL
jgi:hypothetical protein